MHQRLLASAAAVGLTALALPDGLAFTPDGSSVVVANEGEPAEDYSADPDGTVSIVDTSTFAVRTTDFTAEMTAILPLGVKDHLRAGNELDVSDRDGAARLDTWPVYGMYLPDAIDVYTADGRTYLVTANEGDARDWDAYSEEARVAELELCEDAERFTDFDAADSPTGRPMIAVGNEISGTTTPWDVDAGIDHSPADEPTAGPALPVTGTGATGILVAFAAVLALGGGLLLLTRRRAA